MQSKYVLDVMKICGIQNVQIAVSLLELKITIKKDLEGKWRLYLNHTM